MFKKNIILEHKELTRTTIEPIREIHKQDSTSSSSLLLFTKKNNFNFKKQTNTSGKYGKNGLNNTYGFNHFFYRLSIF